MAQTAHQCNRCGRRTDESATLHIRLGTNPAIWPKAVGGQPGLNLCLTCLRQFTAWLTGPPTTPGDEASTETENV